MVFQPASPPAGEAVSDVQPAAHACCRTQQRSCPRSGSGHVVLSDASWP